jgi:hypothetical protein
MLSIFFRLVTVLFLLLIASGLQAQSFVIKGVVRNSTTKSEIPFVNIGIGKRGAATVADSSGAFVLRLREAERKDTLVFSAIGFYPLALPVAAVRTGGKTEFLLRPKNLKLKEVKVKAGSSKWKEKKVGYHIDRGSPFRHVFSPSDSSAAFASGEEIGCRISLDKYPAYLQSISFGLLGSGNQNITVGIRLYSIKNNLPHEELLPEKVVVHIPAHHTGWITVPIGKYNLNLEEDVAVMIEWLNGPNRLTGNSLMSFASTPKGQNIYYREEKARPWQRIRTWSIGLYATVLYEN